MGRPGRKECAATERARHGTRKKNSADRKVCVAAAMVEVVVLVRHGGERRIGKIHDFNDVWLVGSISVRTERGVNGNQARQAKL